MTSVPDSWEDVADAIEELKDKFTVESSKSDPVRIISYREQRKLELQISTAKKEVDDRRGIQITEWARYERKLVELRKAEDLLRHNAEKAKRNGWPGVDAFLERAKTLRKQQALAFETLSSYIKASRPKTEIEPEFSRVRYITTLESGSNIN